MDGENGAMVANAVGCDVSDLLESMFVANDERASGECMTENMHGRKIGLFADGQMFVTREMFINSSLVKTFGGEM
jgi:hypothetical protein